MLKKNLSYYKKHVVNYRKLAQDNMTICDLFNGIFIDKTDILTITNIHRKQDKVIEKDLC
jgi:hypothetical protein